MPLGTQMEAMNSDDEISQKRKKLANEGRLKWFHWVIVILSAFLTIGAWYVSKTQLEEKNKLQFERESTHVVELVTERLQKYEDALWSGVAVINMVGERISYEKWHSFAKSLHIDTKYPGINGIGIIDYVSSENLQSHIDAQQQKRPAYQVFPVHEGIEHFPIVYIEPEATNAKAIGLDIAHEKNRYTAAKKARDSGKAQITGPIVLVQDDEQTAGFLFYTPYYKKMSTVTTLQERRENFTGLVYAPFLVKKLMQGALEKEKRRVHIQLTDTDTVIYDEHLSSHQDYDPNPLFTSNVVVDLYGRSWNFDIRSTKSFRTSTSSNQPNIILVAGIFIEALLLTMFIMLSRASHKALDFADDMTKQLRSKAKSLEKTNGDLEHFAYIASHDLQEPLRVIASYVQLLSKRYKGKLDADADKFIGHVVAGCERMEALIEGILKVSRIDKEDDDKKWINIDNTLNEVSYNLSLRIDETNTKLTWGEMPQVFIDPNHIRTVFQNLISNAIKYNNSDEPEIYVYALFENESHKIFVKDNGIGIDEKYHKKIFDIFKRLHSHNKYTGTGIGLSICKKIIERNGGSIHIESIVDKGTTMVVTLPAKHEDESIIPTKIAA